MNIVLCVRQASATKPIEGSVSRSCVECRAPVWVAPSSVGMIDARPRASFVLCLECAPTITDGGPMEAQPLTDAQVEELARRLSDK